MEEDTRTTSERYADVLGPEGPERTRLDEGPALDAAIDDVASDVVEYLDACREVMRAVGLFAVLNKVDDLDESPVGGALLQETTAREKRARERLEEIAHRDAVKVERLKLLLALRHGVPVRSGKVW